jgi:hypothetical protein
MGWGKKITFAYVGFVALIVTMVVVSMRQKVDLVSKDYYAKELNYQSDINKMANAKKLQSKLKCMVVNNTIELVFPEEHAEKSIQANVFIYKPSDNTADKELNINTNDGRYVISTQDFLKGMYKIKVDWKVENIEYQSESVVVL